MRLTTFTVTISQARYNQLLEAIRAAGFEICACQRFANGSTDSIVKVGAKPRTHRETVERKLREQLGGGWLRVEKDAYFTGL